MPNSQNPAKTKCFTQKNMKAQEPVRIEKKKYRNFNVKLNAKLKNTRKEKEKNPNV